jgi:hypothetical protein
LLQRRRDALALGKRHVDVGGPVHELERRCGGADTRDRTRGACQLRRLTERAPSSIDSRAAIPHSPWRPTASTSPGSDGRSDGADDVGLGHLQVAEHERSTMSPHESARRIALAGLRRRWLVAVDFVGEEVQDQRFAGALGDVAVLSGV